MQDQKDKLTNYFLFKYPLLVLLLLSLFSTKTPYYPLQIVSLTSINAFVGIHTLFSKKDLILNLIKKLIFLGLPIVLILSTIYLNINITNFIFEKNQLILLNVCIFIFTISWLSLNFSKRFKNKLTLVLLGPYLVFSILVQTGTFNDRSKEIRIEAQKIINAQNLNNKKVEIITSGLKNENYTKKS